MLVGSGLLLKPALPAQAAAIIVVNTASDVITADGLCSLREAIEAANTNTPVNECPAGSLPNPDRIEFNFATAQTITLNSALPAITQPVVIDGITGTPAANGAACPRGQFVTIDASASSIDGLLLDLGSDGSTIRGLNIRDAGGADNIQINSNNNFIQCNQITGAQAATGDGIDIAGNANTIGGSSAQDGNIIGGNRQDGIRVDGDENRISFNRIGTNSAGTAADANQGYGIYVRGTASETSISQNLISGNGAGGVRIDGAQTLMNGNYVGLNAGLDTALPNGGSGLLITGSSNTIGGLNYFSGNGATPADSGILVQGTGATGNTIQDNYVGTSNGGFFSVPNAGGGITLIGGASANTIDSNIIGNHADDAGVLIRGSGTNANTVVSNVIGIDINSNGAFPNRYGVWIDEGASGNAIARNDIGGNSIGIQISGTGGSLPASNDITGNFIGISSLTTPALGNTTAGIIFDQLGTGNLASNNFISNNGVGIVHRASVNLAVANDNCILNNSGAEVNNVANPGRPMDAQSNWWGRATGPASSEISGPVDTANFLTSAPPGCDTINSAPFFVTPSPLERGEVEEAYQETIFATDPDSADTLVIFLPVISPDPAATGLPPGLQLVDNGNRTATIFGNPTAIGTYNFFLAVSDSNGSTTLQRYVLVIRPESSSGTGPNRTPVPVVTQPAPTLPAATQPIATQPPQPTGISGGGPGGSAQGEDEGGPGGGSPGDATSEATSAPLLQLTSQALETPPFAADVPSLTTTPEAPAQPAGCAFVPYESRSADWQAAYARRTRPQGFVPREDQQREVLACPQPPVGVVCFPQTEGLLAEAGDSAENVALVDVQGGRPVLYRGAGQVRGDSVCVDFDSAAAGAACREGCALAPIAPDQAPAPAVCFAGVLFALGGLVWLLVLLLMRRRREEADDELDHDLTTA